MLHLLLILNSILFAIFIVFHTIDFLRVIQFREYRWDRFRDFLTTIEGKRWLYDKWRWLIVIFTFAWIFIRLLPIPKELTLAFIILLIGSGDLISLIRKYRSGKLFRPVRTKKIFGLFFIIVVPSLMLEFSWIFYSFRLEEKLYIVLGASVFMMIYSVIVWAVIEAFKQIYLRVLQVRVAKKLRKYPKLTKIGVVGAIGKSSTKGYLAEFLKKDFKVLTPDGNINSEIGLFQFLLKAGLGRYNVCLLEIGAYKRGEVDFIAHAFKPDIAIYTGYSPQHLALYKSKKNILLGDLEIMKHLSGSMKSYVNIDHEFKEDLVKELGKRHKISTVSLRKGEGDIYLDKASSKDSGYEISIKAKGRKHVFSGIFVPIAHKKHLINVLLAISCARDLGVKLNTIKDLAGKIKAPKSALRIQKIKKHDVLWDEYNATYEGCMTALETLEKKTGDGSKICVFSGLFELGREKKSIYGKVAKKMGQVCEHVFCTSEDAFYSLLEAHTRTLYHKLILDLEGSKLERFLSKRKFADVLIEGKVFARWKSPF